ncbi:hypothetical protein HanIR_Chr04g0192521 [Helianthus annuus]|nr:hypothetical protein HanIR_Chr04g0192521 [Helianthus annuus]
MNWTNQGQLHYLKLGEDFLSSTHHNLCVGKQSYPGKTLHSWKSGLDNRQPGFRPSS